MRFASFALEKYFCTFANHQGLFFVIVFFFFPFCFFGFLENYSAHPRGAVEVTVTDGKREACCHREKVRDRKKKKRAVRMKRGKKTQLCGECVAAVQQQQQQKLQGSSLFFTISVVLHFSYVGREGV